MWVQGIGTWSLCRRRSSLLSYIVLSHPYEVGTMWAIKPPHKECSIMKLQVVKATGCAWRARYLYLDGKKIAYIGVDPNRDTAPQLFGGVAGRNFRFKLPYVSFRNTSSPLYLRAYKMSQAFWHGVDGRYGWGS